MAFRVYAWTGLVALASAVPLIGSAETAHRIDTSDVAAAIYAAYPQLAGSAIDLPEPVFARVDAPGLAAGTLERWGAGSAATEHVRLRCKTEGACLPFYATVRVQPTGLAAIAVTAPRQMQETKTAVRSERPVPLVRSGDRVLLLIDSGELHLRIHATCLGNAEAGATVRVAGPQHRVVYAAEVINSDTVRGSL